MTLVADLGGSKQEWAGKIVRSEGVIDSRSRMTYLVAEVIDPYGLQSDKSELRYGTYVTANIAGTDAGDVVVMPRHLVINGQIAILDDDKKLRYKDVNVIRQSGAEVVISDGLTQNMEVIISALDYPVEGMKLALPEDKLLQQNSEGEESDTQLAMEEKE